jgi:hypothetical protein
MWSHQYKLLAADGSTSDIFGRSSNLYGTIAMIGAALDDDKTTDAGMTELRIPTLIRY